MEINGTSACTDYDRFSVNGAVTLGGATLTLTLGYVPSPGDSYTLIANDGADPVSGQFAQGATISSGGYVFSINYAGGDGNDIVLTSCGTGNVQNTDTGEWFCSIQAAIDDAQTLNGHTLSVNAGTYAEDITVNKSLTILGPNAAIDPCSGSRVAEAVVVPKTKDIGATVLFYIAANTDNVSIKGFTLNGDNTALTSGFTSTNGADIDAAEGVATYETGVDNLVVQNNIFKNFSYFGVTHYDYPAGVPSSGHDISNNKFMDLGTYDAGSGISYWGGGVLLYNNAYAHVSNNCMTNVRSGVQTGNFYLPNPGAATYQVIEDNTIQARRRGIFHNLFYSTASPYTLDDNTITALDHASESYWDGILISSHQGVASTTSDNAIDGSAITGKPTEGIEVWNVRSTAPATISGGSVTGVSIGLFVNNYEGYVSDAGEGAHTVVSGLTVTDCPVGAKIFDSPSSTLHAAVNATIQTDCHFSHSSGGTTGILVAGAAASATIQDNSASFHGFTTGIDVDAGSATIDNNHIYDNTTGIRFSNGGSGTVTDNDFSGTTNNDTDLRLDASAGTVGADGGNHFAGSVYGVDNQSAAVVDAENNYWDDATGPAPVPLAYGTGANITTNVDYCPFYGAPGGPALPAANCSFLFSGTILWEHDGVSGVKDATVNLTGAGSGSDLTDVNGDYLIVPPYAAGNYTLTPVKSINKLNGVTVADAVAIQQHVAYITLITSLYKKVAADVNKSNSITTFDATIINQSLLGNPAALAQFKTSWRFAPQSHIMTNPPWGFPESISLTGVTSNQTGQDFYGIKTGDVVATYANPATLGAGEPMALRVQDEPLEAGAEYALEFRAGQLADLAAFQFALRFDAAALEFLEIRPLGALPLTADNFGLFNVAEGEIRAVWSQPAGVFLEEAAPLFELKFKALQSGKLSETLGLDDSVLPGYAYTSAMAESGVQLYFSETTQTNDPGRAAFQLLQNQPNPFSGATTIGFVLPESGEAQLRVFDAAGRLLAERTGQYPAGRHEEVFDWEAAPGVYYYELTTPFGVLAKKMISTHK
ncbi:MAG: T9SS type A sorting domain-containing protein [Saprospirales bacterium]|nr:T9SS type A sorting domain-containing protein [Saprospirales bacterium]